MIRPAMTLAFVVLALCAALTSGAPAADETRAAHKSSISLENVRKALTDAHAKMVKATENLDPQKQEQLKNARYEAYYKHREALMNAYAKMVAASKNLDSEKKEKLKSAHHEAYKHLDAQTLMDAHAKLHGKHQDAEKLKSTHHDALKV